MNLKTILLASAISLTLSGCVMAPQMPTQAQSVILHNRSKAQVADYIAGLCQSYNLNVTDINPSSVSCSMTAGTGAQVWYGTKNGADVEDRTRFLILSPGDKTVRVTAQSNLSAQNVFGGTRTYARPQASAEVVSIMHDLKQWSQE